MPPLNNMIPLLVKLWKLYSDSIKVAVLELTSAYAANLPRGIVNDWPELIKMAQRGVAERSNEVKKAAGDLSLTIASRVTPDLTQNRNFDTFLSFITKVCSRCRCECFSDNCVNSQWMIITWV